MKRFRGSRLRAAPFEARAPQPVQSAAGCRARRGGVVVQVALFSTVMLGMGALAIDIGAMYTTRTELQAAVDAAALAAAGALIGNDQQSPAESARDRASDIARRNPVFGTHVGLDVARDVELGRAIYDPVTQKYRFEPGGATHDAVRITVRRTSDSEGGPLAMRFAPLFGFYHKDLWARASAVLIPRDIAVVIDLSSSMNDDSELQHYRQFTGDYGQLVPGIQVNLRDIWASLDGPAPARPYVPGGETETEYAADFGPAVGAMTTWGSEVVPETYDPTSDAGLWYIPKSSTCTDSAAIASLTARGYSAGDRSILLNGSYDGTSNVFRNRVGVILGLATWRSGRPGGFSGGDGDQYVENGELTWIGYPPYRVSFNWSDYINWVATNSSSSSRMYATNPAFRYRYGLKTFTNWLLEQRPSINQTQLFATPEQPLQAVKDAVQAMTDVIVGLESLDHMSLEIFAQTVSHEVNLTEALQSVPDRLYAMQAGHYNGATNIAGGLQQGINELLSGRARSAAAKVIVLMSDGKPNVNEDGDYVGDNNSTVRDWCYAVAQDAADRGMRVYTISVGSDSDQVLLGQIATIAGGQHFHAEGTPEEYADQLETIFRTLGGRRPVALIE